MLCCTLTEDFYYAKLTIVVLWFELDHDVTVLGFYHSLPLNSGANTLEIKPVSHIFSLRLSTLN